MSPNTWGPPTWLFLHTLAQNIKDSQFSKIKEDIIQSIIFMCRYLPCPTCATHAIQFWNSIDRQRIRNKRDLINVLFMFHNTVNKRVGKPRFIYDSLPLVYGNKNIIVTFNECARTFHTKGNMKLVADAMHRRRALEHMRKCIIQNAQHFDFP